MSYIKCIIMWEEKMDKKCTCKFVEYVVLREGCPIHDKEKKVVSVQIVFI
jgi:hypothetical protein